MSAHDHVTMQPGCYRCDLHRDEVEAAIAEATADAQAAWIEYRDHQMRRGMKPTQFRRREFIAGYLAAEGIEVTA